MSLTLCKGEIPSRNWSFEVQREDRATPVCYCFGYAV